MLTWLRQPLQGATAAAERDAADSNAKLAAALTELEVLREAGAAGRDALAAAKAEQSAQLYAAVHPVSRCSRVCVAAGVAVSHSKSSSLDSQPID